MRASREACSGWGTVELSFLGATFQVSTHAPSTYTAIPTPRVGSSLPPRPRRRGAGGRWRGRAEGSAAPDEQHTNAGVAALPRLEPSVLFMGVGLERSSPAINGVEVPGNNLPRSPQGPTFADCSHRGYNQVHGDRGDSRVEEPPE